MEPAARAPTGPRVLVVDDAAFMRLTLSGLLTRHGFEVAGEAASAEEAVWLYPDLRPDVVLMDVTMPGMGGVEGVRALRRVDPNAKIIMCSAMGQRELVLQAIAAGARDFVVKPFNEERLVGAIKRVLGLKE
ncbi:MAG: response regulator [Desulfotomaculales bacterium]